ncbi:MAG: GTP 3',8-cyclase MoaA [Rhodospirillaceae bacterium]|nr:GTP 3',8-cyclase MoaA [Rhodospirillaceae bacterium]MBL6930033.1 GTP 3',8-cyclase MoaA [Rhodospirillales bacterium]MBL6940943.1 GTP 3',8-cyclase MoaA [Rhodospirillales bacterium]
MIDPLGRHISYLRVSVTDRCDFRCTYCMAEDMTFLPKSDVLTLEELERLCSAFIAKGIRKIRLTGGEPLVRRGVNDLIKSLGKHLNGGGLDELTLTTNGSQLEKHADALFDYGVRRLNVSIDTLDSDKFTEITRGGKLAQVKAGLAAASRAGLNIKINTVALKDFNEDQFSGLLGWCGEQGYDITFIETMPLGDIGGDRTTQYLPVTEVRHILEKDWTLTDCDHNTGGPSRYTDVLETGKRVGFISPLSHNFCATCNRVRVTCTGKLFMCLGQDDNADLRAPLRASEGDEALNAAIEEAIGRKPKAHEFIIEPGNGGPALSRHMSMTGG